MTKLSHVTLELEILQKYLLRLGRFPKLSRLIDGDLYELMPLKENLIRSIELRSCQMSFIAQRKNMLIWSREIFCFNSIFSHSCVSELLIPKHFKNWELKTSTWSSNGWPLAFDKFKFGWIKKLLNLKNDPYINYKQNKHLYYSNKVLIDSNWSISGCRRVCRRLI